MRLRRRAMAVLLALLASSALAGCDWEPVLCVGKHDPSIAVCV